MNTLEITFNTYIIINDEEYECIINASGEIDNNSFDHEFGTEKYKEYVKGVRIDSIYNNETREDVVFSILNKNQRNDLLNLTYDYLVDEYEKYNNEEYI